MKSGVHAKRGGAGQGADAETRQSRSVARFAAKSKAASRANASRSASARASAREHAREETIELHALVERNYAALRRIAQRELAVSRIGATISPTSLVAESVIRLMKQRSLPRNSPHLCGLATILMAQALADRLKHRRAQKRGRGAKPLPILDDVVLDRRHGRRIDHPGGVTSPEILRHLEVLGASIPRTMEVVTLHLVLGIPLERVAEMLDISQRTAYRELSTGREKLARRLNGPDGPA